MKALDKEKSHHQQAKAKPKIGTPVKCDGTRGAKSKIYGVHVVLYIVANPSMFPNNPSKIIFEILSAGLF
ncbi:uncharacterized protein VP01_2870g1 [Puccinia sorghi]|uniref:Uncharacterized protein n=1 Tax=Puccinia sorghi TaxID=27349 RepID=A0A0L6V3M2_9BASI|nr:uncharacterized protein VP01_2870g1 [Puccinia sorghi]